MDMIGVDNNDTQRCGHPTGMFRHWLEPQEGAPVYTRTDHVHDAISRSQTRAQQRIVEEQVASIEGQIYFRFLLSFKC